MTDLQGNTLLHVACQNGNKKAVKFLLRWNCAMSIPNQNQQTPLHYCYGYKYSELAEYLEAKGADATLINAYGLTPKECLEQGLKPTVAGGPRKPAPAARHARPPADAHDLHQRAMAQVPPVCTTVYPQSVPSGDWPVLLLLLAEFVEADSGCD